MALMQCSVETDTCGRELASHGQAMFPIACYDEDLASHLVPWHWHDDFELILITKGAAHVQVEGARIPVRENEAVFINSGALHSVNGGMPEAAQCHSLVFHPRLIGGSVESVFWQTLVSPVSQNKTLRFYHFDRSLAWHAAVVADAAQAWQAVAEEPDDYENRTRYLLSRAFHALQANLCFSETKTSSKDELSAERTKTMMQFIQERYAEELTLERIAGSASVSKSVCLRCFQQVIGTSPIRYVLQYRIEKAAELLRTSNKRMRDVAIDCGFSDISYFTKCFREYKGMPPLAYKRHMEAAR